jgi:hypothetical protein
VYDLQETEAGDIASRLVRRSPYKYDDTMNWTCTNSTSATWVIWRSTVTSTCVRNVTGCGNMLGCCTDMNGPVPEMLSTSILVVCTIQQRPYSTG